MFSFRHAARALATAPLPSALAVMALALGVGANTAIYGTIRSVLLAPLPYTDPDRIVQVWTGHRVSQELYTLLAERLTSVERLDASQTVSLTLLGDGEAWEVPGGAVSGVHFGMLGAPPALGRTLNLDDQSPGGDPVVVLSHGLWQRRFGGEPAVLGRRVQLGDARSPSRTVVGVMGPEHRPLETSWQAWIPLRVDPSDQESWSHHYGLQLHARLRGGITIEAAAAELRDVAARIAGEYSNLFLRDRESAQVVRLLDVTVRDVRGQLLLLAGAVALVMLVACANVANLLLTRGVARQRELAIRAAIGATRGRLARQLLGESALLGLAGGAAGVLLASWLVGLLSVLPADLPRADTVRLDVPVLAFGLALGLACSVLSGLVPAVRAAGPNLTRSLGPGGGTGSGAGRQKLHAGLVMVEVALAVVLVAGAGLLLRSAWKVQRVDPGFRYDSVLALRLSPPPSRYSTAQEITSYYERLLERLARAPGIQAVGAGTLLPLAGERMGVMFEIDGHPPPPGQPPPRAEYNPVSGDFLQALGVPLVSGRWLDDRTDGAEGRPAPVLVNRAFADTFLRGRDPIGRRLTGDGEEWLRIVGVVGDFRQSRLDTAARPAIYLPHGQDAQRRLYVVLRTSGDPSASVPAIGAVVSAVDPLVPITRFALMSDVVDGSLARTRLFAGLLSSLAGLALLLGAVGIYGVVSYGVSQRTREIGVRMALGADRSTVLVEVLRSGLRPVAFGLVAGLALAAASGQILAGYLYDVTARDPATFVAVGLAVLLVGAVAALGPARRASRLDPIVAVRSE